MLRLPSFATPSWLELGWNFCKYSGFGLSVGGKNKSRFAYCVRNVKGNELAKPAPIIAQIRMMASAVRTFERNLGSSVFPAELAAFSFWHRGQVCF